MEKFLSTIGDPDFVKKNLDIFRKNGVESVEELRYFEREDWKEMGFLLAHRRRITRAVSKRFETPNASSMREIDNKEVSIEEKVALKENVNTIDKILKDLSTVFSGARLAELAVFVRNRLDKGTTRDALKMIHDQLDFIEHLLSKSKNPENDCFLSHVQKNHSDFCSSLQLELSVNGIKVWFDMKATRLDSRGMISGVASAKYFVLVACKEYFERTWPVFELLIADIMKKPVIVLVETDERHGGISLNNFCSQLPKIWVRLKDHELMKIQRRYPYRTAFISELKSRCSHEATMTQQVPKSERKENESDEVQQMTKFFSDNMERPDYLRFWGKKLGTKTLEWWKVFAHLHNNKIGDKGVMALCKSIPKNLRRMDLDFNPISNDGYRELAKLIKSPSNLLEGLGYLEKSEIVLRAIEEAKAGKV